MKEQDFFTMIDVAKVNGKYPELVRRYNIKEVPTIVVNGEVYMGQKAFKWLEKKIKNMNHQISSQDTRANKTPIISGYMPDSSFENLQGGGDVQGNSMFCSINNSQKIETPEETDTEYKKSSFILASDNITNGQTVSDGRPDRKSKMDLDLEKLLAEREQFDPKNKPRMF
jgi:hypothetical protein